MNEKNEEEIVTLPSKTLGIVAAVAVVLATFSPIHFGPLYCCSYQNQTFIHEFYVQGGKIEPGEVREDQVAAGTLNLGNPMAITAIHATISALPSLNVQIWLSIDGQGNLFHVNSGSLGTANSDLGGLYIIVPAGTDIKMMWWCDNLSSTTEDFHASITIFFYQ